MQKNLKMTSIPIERINTMTTQDIPLSATQDAVYDAGELYLLPQLLNVGGEVADFWSTVFPDAAAQHDEYEQLVQTAIQQAGLVAKTERVSFGHGVILGKARPFFTVRRGSVSGTEYIGK